MSIAADRAAATSTRRRRRGAAHNVWGVLRERLVNYAGFLVALFLIWRAAIWIWTIPPYLLPGPVAALTALGDNAGLIGISVAVTVGCTLAGMAISVTIAILLALAFLLSDLLSRALMPLVIVIRTVPMIAIAPLIVIVLGRGAWNSIGMVALLTFFQILLGVKKGLVSPTRNALEMMHTSGASVWQTLIKVRVPFAIPFVFTGLRIASGSALLCAMFAEWLSGSPGLGTLILNAYSTQNFPLMWAATLSSTTAAYLFFTLTIVAERMVLNRLG
jgi:NitT/TauT family transport system permease protein